MAINFFSGFEMGDLTDFAGSSGSAVVQNTVKRTGNYALNTQATGFSSAWASVWPIANGIFSAGGFTGAIHYRFYFRYATGPNGFAEPISGASGGNPIHSVRLNPDGTLAFYDNSTLRGTSALALSPNTWYRIDVTGTVDGSGVWTVSVDGVLQITTASIFTQMVQLHFGRSTIPGNQTATLDFFYDDIVVGNSALPAAETRVVNYAPTANGNTTEFAVGTGNTFAEVDDYTDNDGSYIASNVNGQSHYTKMTPDIQAGGNIHALMSVSRVRANLSTNLGALSFRNNGQEGNLLQNFPTSYNNYQLLRETDPDGGGAWSLADLNTVEVGVKTNTINSGDIRATSFVTKVLFDGTAGGGGSNPGAPNRTGFLCFFK